MFPVVLLWRSLGLYTGGQMVWEINQFLWAFFLYSSGSSEGRSVKLDGSQSLSFTDSHLHDVNGVGEVGGGRGRGQVGRGGGEAGGALGGEQAGASRGLGGQSTGDLDPLLLLLDLLLWVALVMRTAPLSRTIQ